MLNQVVCVGRVVDKPQVKELENGKKVGSITIAIPRSYKNENGEYETDFVDCTLWNHVAETTSEYINKGDMIGVKGTIKTEIYEKEDGTKQKATHIVADRVTFLSSKTKEMEETKEDKDIE